jgi:hypothetical protein
MIRVLYVEATSGGVVGGSLTGLYHLIRGLDRNRFEPAMVLYTLSSLRPLARPALDFKDLPVRNLSHGVV